MLKAFQSFDDGKTGFVATFKVSSMLKSMKLLEFDKDRLARAIEQHDPDSKLSMWVITPIRIYTGYSASVDVVGG